MARLRPPSALLLLSLVACADPGTDPTTPPGHRVPAPVPPQLSHDFGAIPHGKAGEHDYVLDTRSLGGDYVAVGVQVDCSCARYQMLLRDARGAEREVFGQPIAENAPRAGEVLVIRMLVDTAQKEARDLGPVTTRATVLLQPVPCADPTLRVHWPLQLRYAIDAPVQLQPFAVLDFERVPISTQPTVLTTLRSDIEGRTVHFGPATCNDERVALQLEPDGDRTVLRASFRPQPAGLGPFRALVEVATDLPDGYVVRLPLTGTVVPDLEVVPFAKLAFRTDLASEQPEQAASSQYLLLTDHDRRRTSEFALHEITDERGQDARAHFAIRFEPLLGDDRTHRMFVRYLGGLQDSFRGRIVLTKPGVGDLRLPIDLVVFPQRTP